jgi:hypothetical protein
MIGHQAVGVNPQPELRDGFGERVNKPPSILVIAEDVPSLIAAGHHVIDRSRKLHTNWTRHVPHLVQTNLKCQESSVDPHSVRSIQIRNDQNYWQQVDTYISDHSEAQFTHGICPECREKIMRPELERLKVNEPAIPI